MQSGTSLSMHPPFGDFLNSARTEERILDTGHHEQCFQTRSSFLFSSAIWNSYSKPDIALNPFITARAPTFCKIGQQPGESCYLYIFIFADRCLNQVYPFFNSKRRFLLSLLPTATISLSQKHAALTMISRCPFVIGSKLPGYTNIISCFYLSCKWLSSYRRIPGNRLP